MAATLRQKPILYSFFISSCSWRVRNALSYKGIDYEYRAVNLLKNEQGEEEFKKLNPMSQVPALVVDGKTITQSISILEFLEESFPQKPLLPVSAFDRAKIREICELIGSGIQPLQNLAVANKQKGMSPKDWSHHFNRNGLQALEKILVEISGQYCFEDQVTLADCCLVPQVFSAEVRFDVDLEEFPVISKIYQNLNALQAFKVAHPLQQPDSPNKH